MAEPPVGTTLEVPPIAELPPTLAPPVAELKVVALEVPPVAEVPPVITPPVATPPEGTTELLPPLGMLLLEVATLLAPPEPVAPPLLVTLVPPPLPPVA